MSGSLTFLTCSSTIISTINRVVLYGTKWDKLV